MRKDWTCVSVDQGKKNPISALITLCKQVSYRVNNALNISYMPTTLIIYVSIITVCEFRDVSSEDFQDCFSPSSRCPIHFQSPYHIRPSRVQRTKDLVRWVVTEGSCLTKCVTVGNLILYVWRRKAESYGCIMCTESWIRSLSKKSALYFE